MNTPDPTLKDAAVMIRYSASDGYKSEAGFMGGNKRSAAPEEALLGALEELARLTALFGLQSQAEKRVAESFQRVADWRAAR